MKKFDAPEMNIEILAVEDVITTSNAGNGDNNTGDQEM